MTKYLIVLITLLGLPILGLAQNDVRYSEDPEIKDGFHVAPIVMSTKGYSFGAGYAFPVRPRLMFHGTATYMVTSYLDDLEVNCSGIGLFPSMLFFPDRVPNFKGIVLGLELPVMYYQMSKHNWISRTSTGENSTFVYTEYELTRAKAFQTGLGVKFGFRTHRRNTKFFWQPTLTLGALYQHLSNYTENDILEEDVINGLFLDNPFVEQNTGIVPYFKFELDFGLYRYKKEMVRTIEI